MLSWTKKLRLGYNSRLPTYVWGWHLFLMRTQTALAVGWNLTLCTLLSELCCPASAERLKCSRCTAESPSWENVCCIAPRYCRRWYVEVCSLLSQSSWPSTMSIGIPLVLTRRHVVNEVILLFPRLHGVYRVDCLLASRWQKEELLTTELLTTELPWYVLRTQSHSCRSRKLWAQPRVNWILKYLRWNRDETWAMRWVSLRLLIYKDSWNHLKDLVY